MRYKEVTVQLKDGPRILKKKRSMVPFWIVVILLILGLSMLMISIPNNIRFDQFGTIFSQMFVPSKWSLKTWDGYRDYIFNTAIIKILQTLEMVSIATFLGTCISVPFYILASSNIFTSKWVHMPVRILLNIFRSIPTFVLAVIATIFFGFNETSGIIAMALFTGGVLFKLMYEQIETCDMNPYEASRSTGASILQAYNIAISPQIKPTLISNVIYVFEINVRASVILGFVGAGGIGQLLSDAIESTQYDKVGAILIPLFIVVIFLQFLSSFLRRRIH
jgi:phosphonate transport system permease protein